MLCTAHHLCETNTLVARLDKGVKGANLITFLIFRSRPVSSFDIMSANMRSCMQIVLWRAGLSGGAACS